MCNNNTEFHKIRTEKWICGQMKDEEKKKLLASSCNTNSHALHTSTRVHLPFITWTIALVPSALVGAQE